MLCAAGPVLDAGAGRAAAELGHDLHEPADHRPPPGQQEGRQEEDHRDTQPQAYVRGGIFFVLIIISIMLMNQFYRGGPSWIVLEIDKSRSI